MPILSDPRLELFACELALALNAGVRPSEAAVQAGTNARYLIGKSAKTFAANCRKRAQRADVQRRITELREPGIFKAEKDVEVTTEYLMRHLVGIIEFNRDDFLSEPDETGERHFTLKAVPRDLIGRVGDLKIASAMIGRGKARRRVSFVADVSGEDRIGAMRLAAQIKGLLAPESRRLEVGDTLAAVLKEIDGRTRGLPSGA